MADTLLIGGLVLIALCAIALVYQVYKCRIERVRAQALAAKRLGFLQAGCDSDASARQLRPVSGGDFGPSLEVAAPETYSPVIFGTIYTITCQWYNCFIHCLYVLFYFPQFLFSLFLSSLLLHWHWYWYR
jgi:hypothetical protein